MKTKKIIILGDLESKKRFCSLYNLNTSQVEVVEIKEISKTESSDISVEQQQLIDWGIIRRPGILDGYANECIQHQEKSNSVLEKELNALAGKHNVKYAWFDPRYCGPQVEELKEILNNNNISFGGAFNLSAKSKHGLRIKAKLKEKGFYATKKETVASAVAKVIVPDSSRPLCGRTVVVCI